MKKVRALFFSLFCTVLTLPLLAQNPQFTPRGVPMHQMISRGSDGKSLTLNIPDADQKLAEKVWVDYLRSMQGIKAKKAKKSKEYVAEDVRVSGIANGQNIDLFGRADEVGKSVQFVMWYDPKTSAPEPASATPKQPTAYAYASYQPDNSYNAAFNLLNGFRLEVEREKVRQRLADEEKQLDKLERELRQLKSANDRYHKDIENAEKRIQEAKQNIVKNEQEQQTAVNSIESQQKRIQEVQQELNKIN